jgi:hypothetical protein
MTTEPWLKVQRPNSGCFAYGDSHISSAMPDSHHTDCRRPDPKPRSPHSCREAGQCPRCISFSHASGCNRNLRSSISDLFGSFGGRSGGCSTSSVTNSKPDIYRWPRSNFFADWTPSTTFSGCFFDLIHHRRCVGVTSDSRQQWPGKLRGRRRACHYAGRRCLKRPAGPYRLYCS